MKNKILNTLLLFSSFFGFLEWGNNKKMFLFQIEAEVFSKIPHDPFAILHPFILFPLIGQVLLIITLIKKNPAKLLTYIGIGGIGILMLLVLLVGCLSKNLMIILSTIPFITISYFSIRHNWKTDSK
jgi:hypothetical protein